MSFSDHPNDSRTSGSQIIALLVNQFDKFLAVLGIFFSLFLILYLEFAIGRPVYVAVGFFTLISCIMWLVLRNKKSTSTDDPTSNHTAYRVLNVLFLVFFILSIISIKFRSDVYVRPIEYFIFTAIMAGMVALEVLFKPSEKSSAQILSQIILIGLSLTFSQLLIFPSVVGIDPWYHQMFTSEIINLGHIPANEGYSNLPVMHLGIASTAIILDLDYKTATMLSMTVLQIILGVLLIFLLGKFLVNKRVGLLAAVLLVTANQYINMGFWMIPNAIAAVFIPIILYLLFKKRNENPLQTIVLVMILMATLVLCHTIAALCMAMLLFTSFIIHKIYNILHNEKKMAPPVSLSISIFFIVFMFAWWTYASGSIMTLANLIEWGFSRDYFVPSVRLSAYEQYISTVPFAEQLFNQLGMFLFFALSFVGCFYMLSRRHGNSHTFTFAIIGLVPLSLGFFSLISAHSIIEHRWWYFAQILLAVPLAIAFLLFAGNLKNHIGKAVLTGSLVILLSFIMMMAPIANMDNPVFSQNTGIRCALTESEITGAYFFADRSNSTISSDYYEASRNGIFINYIGMDPKRVHLIDDSLYNMNFVRDGSIVIIRNEIVSDPFSLYGSVYRIHFDPGVLLDNAGFSKIYDSHSVSGYQ